MNFESMAKCKLAIDKTWIGNMGIGWLCLLLWTIILCICVFLYGQHVPLIQQHLLLSKCKMTGLFGSCIRISLLVLSGDKRSCMLPINMFLLVGHGHIAVLGYHAGFQAGPTFPTIPTFPYFYFVLLLFPTFFWKCPTIPTFCPPPFRRKVEGHCFWFSVVRGAWRVVRGAWFRVFSRYFVPLTPPTVSVRSFWNFTDVLRMVWRYACGFFRILK